MKKRAKAKASKGSSKSSETAKNELPELVAIMMKIAERLEALEKKTDLVISQTSVRSFEGRDHSKPASQPFVAAQPFRRNQPARLGPAGKHAAWTGYYHGVKVSAVQVGRGVEGVPLRAAEIQAGYYVGDLDHRFSGVSLPYIKGNSALVCPGT